MATAGVIGPLPPAGPAQTPFAVPQFLQNVPTCNTDRAYDVLERLQNALHVTPRDGDEDFKTMYSIPGDGDAVGFDDSPDQWAENAEGDDDDDDDNSDNDSVSDNNLELLEEGTKNALDLQAIGVVVVPLEVAKVQARAFSSFRKMWTEGYSPSMVPRLESANHVIRDFNSKAGRDVDDHQIPHRQIASIIPVIRSMASHWARAKAAGSTEVQSRCSRDTACVVLSLLGTVAPTGMSWKYLVPTAVRGILYEIMDEGMLQIDPSLRDRVSTYISRDQVVASSLQVAIAKQAKEPLKSLVKYARAGNIERVTTELRNISKVNDELLASNRELCLKDNDHLLPVNEMSGFAAENLREMSANVRKAHVDRLARFAARYLHEIGYMWLAEQVERKPQLISLGAEDQQQLEQALGPRILEFAYPIDENKTPLEDPETPSDTRARTSETASSTDTITSGTTPPTSQSVTTSDSDGRSQPLIVSSEASSIANVGSQAEPLSGLRQSSVDGIHYGDGVTLLGKVDHIQCLRKDVYRVLLNVGTENVKVYKSFPGLALGRGMAEELQANNPDKTAKREAIKDKKAKDVRKVQAVVQVESKTLEPKMTPITKYLVQWKGGIADSWIIRTDLMWLCGKEYEKRCFATLVADWRYNLDFLEKMQSENRHPETGQPLQESDRAATPWLFQRSQPDRTGRRGQNSRDTPSSEQTAPPPLPESRRFGA